MNDISKNGSAAMHSNPHLSTSQKDQVRPGSFSSLNSILRTIAILLIAILFTACGEASVIEQEKISQDDINLIKADNFPKIDGSTSTSPISSMIICQTLRVECSWMEFPDGSKILAVDLRDYDGEFPPNSHTGTHNAYLNLIERKSDLILVARLPSAEEQLLAMSAGSQFIIEPIALDAFVFIVNEDNPVEQIASDDIRSIYSGEITNWEELGGPASPIQAYQRNDQSGSQELMQELVMLGVPMVALPDLILPTMIAPFYAISEDIAGISYSVYYYEENMAPNERIKLIAVDGFQPTPQNIGDQSYPYTTRVYAVIRDDLPSNSSAYILRDWLLTPEGQSLIEESGYIPIKE